MKIEKTVCDRCGKEIENTNPGYLPTYSLKDYCARINFWNVGEARSFGGQRIDICPECCDKFIRFMDGDNSE